MMKQNIILTKKDKSINGTIQLTGSKSECNRALVIEALSHGKVKVKNVSDAADTVTLAGILGSGAGSEFRGSGLGSVSGSGDGVSGSGSEVRGSDLGSGDEVRGS